ncbi:FKBP-type 22 kDa peptidyl-prolyl cis-trans isomerase [Lacunisphaera limnophila]|uniref:Peptidyl-prolyl cis-trans isomerase n=1 Tax=Lacunisphaera limnophila TaxID=1838286 RepID=A0A1D8ATF4_9BACT|nr:FKBP-type peptidyl-prolyl cis-trans isomerase [Lacunisphaera limnophila]AOS44178.1 FKBP-type 22 kDa peptidyl-prolyl cis-trans isomerase [Lacunisphaera limnophila]
MTLHSPVIRATLAVLVLSLTACGKKPAEAPAPKAAVIESVDQKVSYGIGFNIGSGLARDRALAVDQAALFAGVSDGLAKAETRVKEADLEAAFQAMQQKMTAALAAEGEKQLAEGQAYLAQNKAKPGVTVTASGLQYELLATGTGAKPKETDTVKVHYHGMLTNGTVFDSSVQRGEPVEFPLTRVISGWTEALQLMSVGDKWKLTIPAGLAYGSQPKGDIPPNSVLIFEVELLGIQ